MELLKHQAKVDHVITASHHGTRYNRRIKTVSVPSAPFTNRQNDRLATSYLPLRRREEGKRINSSIYSQIVERGKKRREATQKSHLETKGRRHQRPNASDQSSGWVATSNGAPQSQPAGPGREQSIRSSPA